MGNEFHLPLVDYKSTSILFTIVVYSNFFITNDNTGKTLIINKSFYILKAKFKV